MNLGDILAECGRLLSDVGNSRWSQATLTSRANIAQTEIQGITSAVLTYESLTPTAATHGVSVNSNTMNIVRATKTLTDGSVKPLLGMTVEKLDFMYPDWAQWPSSEPLYFYYDANAQEINLVPAPDSSNAIANGIELRESRVPTALASSTDIPFDSNNQMTPFHMAIVHWVVATCFMDDGTQESLAKSIFHKSGNMLRPGAYEKELGRIMAEFDQADAVPSNILFRPQGGRIGSIYIPSKSNPLA